MVESLDEEPLKKAIGICPPSSEWKNIKVDRHHKKYSEPKEPTDWIY